MSYKSYVPLTTRGQHSPHQRTLVLLSYHLRTHSISVKYVDKCIRFGNSAKQLEALLYRCLFLASFVVEVNVSIVVQRFSYFLTLHFFTKNTEIVQSRSFTSAGEVKSLIISFGFLVEQKKKKLQQKQAIFCLFVSDAFSILL